MKIKLFLLLSLCLTAEPIKVPTERYKNFPDLKDHLGHYPFISYLTYRNVCDHIINESTEWFDPDLVKPGDLIYLNLWYLEWFTQQVHDRIPHPYILVSGDIGGWFPQPEFSKLLYDPKLAAWFCRNMVFSYHPKLFQLPMGQDLALFYHGRGLYDQLISAVVHKGSVEKKHLLYMCFLPRTHGDRDKIEKMFIDKPYCYSINRPVSNLDEWSSIYRPTSLFYEDIASSYFTLSPLGLETDSVRTWEALVLDSIPIVEHTFLDPTYEGLPVVMVHDWNEINPEFLHQKQEELKGLKLDKAYFDYWWDLLKSTKQKVQNNDHSFSELDATEWKEQDLSDLTEIVSSCQNINYLGFLASIRPYELAQALPYLTIDLYDPWLDQTQFKEFNNTYSTPNVFFHNYANRQISSSCFLDLTYYRTSLDINFRTSVIQDGNFRHSLKKDLNKLWNQLKMGSLLCGNCCSDPYVQKALEIFANENELQINRKGSFWFLMKEKIHQSLNEILPDPYPAIYSTIELLPFNSQGWYEHHAIFEELFANSEIKHIVDVGSWMGKSTCHFAKLIPKDGIVFAVDHFLGSGLPIESNLFQQFLSNVVHEQLTDQIVPVRMNSANAARKLQNTDIPIDLVYIDAAQDYDSVINDLRSWYPLIENHGILCGDDWRVCDVQSAVTEFAQEKNLFLYTKGDFWMYLPGF